MIRPLDSAMRRRSKPWMAGLIALMGLLPLLGEASARQDVRATRRWTPAISEPGVSALYTTATNAPGIAVCEIGDVRAEYQWDRFGARLTNLVWKVNDTAIASFAQTYPTNDIHRIERRERLDGSHWDYLYDGVGRLTNAVLRLADGNVAPGDR